MDRTVDRVDTQIKQMSRAPQVVFLRVITGVLFLGLIFYAAFGYTVRSSEAAIVSRLGQPRAVVQEPGLHGKFPWPIESVIKVDVRRRVFSTRHTEMLTKDKRNVILLSDAVWSISDPLLYYRTIGLYSDWSNAEQKLDGLITNAKIAILGKYPLSALASTQPEELKGEQIEQELFEEVAPIALERYGIKIHSVGFSRLSLPERNLKAVFQQMRAERKQAAARYKAEGEREATQLRSATELEIAELEASSTKEAAEITGQAEARAAQIYAEAYSVDPDLYRFVRSLETLDDTIGARSTLILRTDSSPFELLTDSKKSSK